MAGKNTSIALGEHFVDHARRKVESGEYSSISEVVRDAVRWHEERSLFRSKLIAALDVGLASPIDKNVDIDTGFAEKFGSDGQDN